MPRLKVDIRNAEVRGIVAQKVIALGIHTNNALAVKLGISYPALMRRLREPRLFTLEELQKMQKVLRFTDEDILTIVRGAK